MIAHLPRLPLLFVIFVLAACGSDGNERPEYQGAEYYKNLEFPPDLSLHKSREELVIPRPSESALSDYQASSQLDIGVLPQFRGIRLRSEGSLYWLEADVSPDTAWSKLESFWEHEGIRLLQNEPLLGFMETEWTNRLVVDEEAGFLARMFSRLEPDLLDRFRMRVETTQDRALTRVFVSHAGMERFVEGGEDDTSIVWRRRPSDPDLEREILGRLLLFAGLSENQRDSLLKDYRPYQSYVRYVENVLYEEADESSIEENERRVAELSMQGSMDFVWRRCLRALDRLELTDIEADRASGSIVFTSGSDIDMTRDDEQRDELAESSWLMNLFRSSDDTNKSSQRFTLQLTDQGGSVRLDLLDRRGLPADSVRAQQLRAALAHELE